MDLNWDVFLCIDAEVRADYSLLITILTFSWLDSMLN